MTKIIDTDHQENNLLGFALPQITNEVDDWLAMYLKDEHDAFLITRIVGKQIKQHKVTQEISDNNGINAINSIITLENDQILGMINEMTEIKINDADNDRCSIRLFIYGENCNDGDDLMSPGLGMGSPAQYGPKAKIAMKAMEQAKAHKEKKLAEQKEKRHTLDSDDYNLQ